MNDASNEWLTGNLSQRIMQVNSIDQSDKDTLLQQLPGGIKESGENYDHCYQNASCCYQNVLLEHIIHIMIIMRRNSSNYYKMEP